MTRRDPLDWHTALMLVLTFSTGIVDAVGYLGLDRVFTANMTGNVVILGMALTGSQDLPIVGPVLALLGFLGGAALVGRVLRRAATGWTTASSVVFALVGVVLGALAVVTSLLDGVPVEPGTSPPPAAVLVTTVLGLAMGGQAAAARRLGVKDVTTVVVTSTLTGLAADSRLAGGTGDGWRRRLGAVVLILAGAAVGAALLRWHVGAGLALAGLISLVAAWLGHGRAHVGR
ncbi:YoaK family protein [Kineococcus rhizosphaerae]|uniref:YoaK family protein n=1 Tax=Kineococcus rhizosphaerae TaxID=559628 RepID=UPI001FE800B3|nr:YoaK family protein [Kineococcus rhizosphaerae]